MDLLRKESRKTEGVVVDQETRRKKQQALMTELLERKIRLHAQHIYDQRGQAEGHALADWVQAESTVLENSILAPLYRRAKTKEGGENELAGDAGTLAAADCCA
jgi:hypothetical protein